MSGSSDQLHNTNAIDHRLPLVQLFTRYPVIVRLVNNFRTMSTMTSGGSSSALNHYQGQVQSGTGAIGTSPSGHSTVVPRQYQNKQDTPSALLPSAHSRSNQEKKALRDALAKQDAEANGAKALASRRRAVERSVPNLRSNESTSIQSSTQRHRGQSLPPSSQTTSTVKDSGPRSPRVHRGYGSSIDQNNTQGRQLVTALRHAPQAPLQSSLPDGMDVREALSKCEDPALGWSMQFWVTIASDPSVSHA